MLLAGADVLLVLNPLFCRVLYQELATGWQMKYFIRSVLWTLLPLIYSL